MIDLEGPTCPVAGIGDALIQAEGCPGGARELEVEVGEEEEDVRIYEGIWETVWGGDESVSC